MNPARRIILGSVAAILGLVGLLSWNQKSPATTQSVRPLLVYCAAGLRSPVQAVARDYEREFGVPVQLQFGGSGTLLNNLKISRRGDVFLAADSSFVDLGRSNGLIAEVIPVARITPVIAVPRGNPRGLASVADLLRPDIRVALANPETAAIGVAARTALTHTGQWAPLAARATVFKPTVNDVANDVKLGAVDAGIVWDATIHQYPELTGVPAPEFGALSSEVAACVLSFGDQPRTALHFSRFLTARDRGLRRFTEAGYQVSAGDGWAPEPGVVLFSGTVNRIAIEKTLKEFEQREGVRVTRVYNGCGLLTAQIKAGRKPDAYLASDVSFMQTVTNALGPAIEIAETPLILLVKKGNPSGIAGLADLARPGLKVGLAQEQQSALGALSARILRNAGLYSRVIANVSTLAPTDDLLLNSLRSGSLDVALVYDANASRVRGVLDTIPLRDPGSIAIQLYAVGRHSDHAQLMERLLSTLCAGTSRTRFEQAGFRWKGPGEKP